MTDFLGQNLKVGDFVIIKSPYSKDLTIGRVLKLNNSSNTVAYIPPWVWYDDEISFEDDQLILNSLCSDDFADYSEKGEKKLIIRSGRYSTARNNGEWELCFWATARRKDELVRIEKDQLKNFIDSRLD